MQLDRLLFKVAPFVALGGAAMQTASGQGITPKMMPVSVDEIRACRVEAAGVAHDDQSILSAREKQQDKDRRNNNKIAIIGAIGSTAASQVRGNGSYAGYTAAQVAGAITQARGGERNSAPVASETAALSGVARAAYEDCIDGVKNKKYLDRYDNGFAAPAAPAALAAPRDAQTHFSDVQVSFSKGTGYLIHNGSVTPFKEPADKKVPYVIKAGDGDQFLLLGDKVTPFGAESKIASPQTFEAAKWDGKSVNLSESVRAQVDQAGTGGWRTASDSDANRTPPRPQNGKGGLRR